MVLARWRPVAVLTIFTAVGSACGAGTAGLVSGGGGGSGGNAPPAISGFTIEDPKVSPTQIRFVLSDAEGNPAQVELRYQVGGAPAQHLTQFSGVNANPATLATSAQGVEYTLQWDFAAESDLPDDASYVPDIQVFGTVAGGIQEIQVGANAAATGLGNDPPVVVDAVVPAGEVDGIIGIAFVVADSSDDIVKVRVEYDVIGDVPDAQWKLARPALVESTPDFAFDGVLARAEGSALEFFWDTDVDLAELERDVRLRFTAVDPVVEGAGVETATLHVDNNAEPIVAIQSDVFVLNSDERRGIPIPITVIDEERDDVEVVFQWRREGEAFPELPDTAAEIQAILIDPELRQAHRVCSEFPRPVEGIPVPIDATHVRLPELAGQAAHLLAAGIVGRELEIMRPPNRFESLAQQWASSGAARGLATSLSAASVRVPVRRLEQPLVHPVAAVPVGDGLTALVLDSPAQGAWRLRELELSTGALVRDLATAAGDPSAMALERNERAALIASDVAGVWQVARVELDTASMIQLIAWEGTTEQGQIRGIASLGTGAALATVGSSLVRLDYESYPNTSSATLLDGLATPWGIVLDPLDANRVYVAERDVVGPLGLGGVSRVDLNGLCVEPVVLLAARPNEPGFVRPGPLAIERGNRLLAVCDIPQSQSAELRGVDLGGREANRVFPLVSIAAGATALATGADGLRLVTRVESADLLACGGIEQRRRITHDDRATHIASVDSAFVPALGRGTRWRISEAFKAASDIVPMPSVFVWDTADVQGGEILLRATPLDAEVGVPSTTVAPRRVLAPLQSSEPLVVALPDMSGPRCVTSSDLDGDGDRDLISANQGTDNLTVFFQTSPGVFADTPLVLGGTGATEHPVSVNSSDLDGDGDQDIVSANGFGGNLTVFFQTSPAGFADTPLVLGGTGQPSSVTSSDLDGDGDQDIVSANASSSNLTVFFQTSPGVFADTPLVLGGTGTTNDPLSVTSSDLDRDGDQDIVSANYNANNLTVFFQASPGVFAQTPLVLGGLGTTNLPISVTSSDLDGDGDQDVVSANQGTDNLTVFFQASPGVFAQTPLVLGGLGTTNLPISVTSSDLDGDGDQDVVSANYGGNNLTVFFQTSPGAFSESPLVLASAGLPVSVTSSDLDGDGDQDIVSANSEGTNLTVFPQVSPGIFAQTPLVLGGVGVTNNPFSVTSSDLDRDGDQDLVSANSNGNNLTVFFQTSLGVFAHAPLVLASTGVPVSVIASDLDGDGDSDIASANLQGSNLTVFFQSSPGIFTPIPLVLGGIGTTVGPASLTASDLDGDSDQDIVSGSFFGSHLTVFFQTSPGVFAVTPLVLGAAGTTDSPRSVNCSDLNGDGDQDICSANAGSHNLTVFFQTSPGVFAAPPLVLGGAGTTDAPVSVTSSDLDGDGDQDLVCANQNGNNLTVFFQTSPGIFAQTPLVLGGVGVTNNPGSVTSSDLDRDGDQDIVSASYDGSGGLTVLSVFVQTSPGAFARNRRPLVVGNSGNVTTCVVSSDLDGDGDQDIVSANLDNNNLTVFWGAH